MLPKGPFLQDTLEICVLLEGDIFIHISTKRIINLKCNLFYHAPFIRKGQYYYKIPCEVGHWRSKLQFSFKITHQLTLFCYTYHMLQSLQWRHNEHDGVLNHQPYDCSLNRLFRRRSKRTSKLRGTGLCAVNSPGWVNSPHKWPVTRTMFPFDDVIMYPSLKLFLLMLSNSFHEHFTSQGETPMLSKTSGIFCSHLHCSFRTPLEIWLAFNMYIM